MLTVLWNLDDFPIAEFLPRGKTLNISYFRDNILIPAIQQLQAAHRGKGRTVLHLHSDNCKVHDFKRAQICYDDDSVVRIPHPHTLRI
jgi:hypothetical protein